MIKDFGTGIGLLIQGFRLVLSNRSMLVRGALPVLLTSALMFAGLAALIANIGDLISWATPFADEWAATWQRAVRLAAGFVVVIAAVAVSLLLFSGLTLVIGGPFYESIAEHVEDTVLGGVPDAERNRVGSGGVDRAAGC